MAELGEVKVAEHQGSRGLRKENAFYDKVEQQIRIVKNLWNTSNSFRPPSPLDTPDDINDESLKLRNVFNDATETFPQSATLYRKFQDLEKKDRSKGLRGKKKDRIFDELMGLRRKEGVSFFLQLDNGVDNLLSRRQEIREIMSQLGNNWDKPEAYSPFFEDHPNIEITRVIPGNFSISLVLTPDSFKAVDSRKGLMGYHRGVWDVIKETSSSYSYDPPMVGIFGEETIKQAEDENLNTTIKHERFHAFIDAFHNQRFRTRSEIARAPFERYFRLKELGAPEVILEHNKRMLIKGLPYFVSFANEELVAEIVSKEHDSPEHGSIPSRTFAEISITSFKELDKIVGLDTEIDEAILKLKETMSLDRLRERIQGFYGKVREEAPEHLDDLDVALALFPPPKYQHIEQLIERWTSKTKTEVPQ